MLVLMMHIAPIVAKLGLFSKVMTILAVFGIGLEV